MNKKYRFFLLTAFSIPLLAGCGSIDYKYDENSSEYNANVNNGYEGDNDPSITIDGKLNEEEWQNKKWQQNTFVANDGSMPYTYTTAFTTEYGIYIGAKALDKNIKYTGDYSPANATCYEIYFWVQSKFEPTHIDGDWTNVMYLTTDCGGVGHGNLYSLKRAVTVDGEINSGNTKSVEFEFFIPWESIGKERFKNPVTNEYEYPEEVNLIGQYRACLLATGNNSLVSFTNIALSHHSQYFHFNREGYYNEDKKDAIVGDSANGHAKTANWILDKESDGVFGVEDGVEAASIFFKEAFNENFVMETLVIPTKRLSGITEARASQYGGHYSGLYMMTPNGGGYGVLFNFNDEKFNEPEDTENRHLSRITLMTLNTISGWSQNIIYDRPGGGRLASDGVRLKVVKYGKQLHYFVDNSYVYSQIVDDLSGKVFAGFYTLNMGVNYEDYSFKTLNASEASTLLNNYDIYEIYADSNEGMSIESYPEYVANNGSANFALALTEGYEMKSVTLNNDDYTEYFFNHFNDGVFTVENVSATIGEDCDVYFRTHKIANPIHFTGNIYHSDKKSAATLILTKDDGTRYYYESSSNGAFDVRLNSGTYKVDILIEEESPYHDEIILSSNFNKDYTVPTSDFYYEDNDGINFTYNFVNHKVEYNKDTTYSYCSYLRFKEELASGSMISTEIDVVNTKDPCVGLTIEDGKNSLQVYLLSDLVNSRLDAVRLLTNRRWENITQFNTASFVDGHGKLTLILEGTSLYIYSSDEYVTTVDLTSFGLDEASKYIVGFCAWNVQTTSVTPTEPMISFSNWDIETDEDIVETYKTVHSLETDKKNAEKVGLEYINGYKYNPTNKTIYSTTNKEFQTIFCKGASDKVYLKNKIYSTDLDGITIQNEYGENVQICFQFFGIAVMENYQYSAPKKVGDIYCFNTITQEISETDVSHLWGEEVEYAISEGILYVTLDGNALFSIPLSRFNDNFTATSQYTIGFFAKAPYATAKYPKGRRTYFEVGDNFFSYGDDASGAIENAKSKF